MFNQIKEKVYYSIKKIHTKKTIKTNEYKSIIEFCNKKLFYDADNKCNRMAIYTAIIGGYDVLLKQNYVNENCDYYCITDNKDIKSDNLWRIIYIDKEKYDLSNVENTKIARYVKTHPHIFFKEYKHTMWIDSNIVFEKDPSEWICKYLNSGDSMLLHLHNDRKTVAQEAFEIVRAGKDTKENVYSQINKYITDGFNCDADCLTMTNVIYRKNTEEINNFNEIWWNEILNNSKRDQLSFNYSAWKANLKYSTCSLDPFGNEYFTRFKHKKTIL